MKSTLVLFCSLFFLIGCSRTVRTDSQIFEKPFSDCIEQAIPSEYVVLYKNNTLETVSANSDDELIELLDNVENSDEILMAEPVYKIKIDQEIQKPITIIEPTNQPVNNWGPERIQAQKFWEQGVFGNDVLVAVIDSGVDTLHRELENQIFTNPNEVLNGLDDDNNGLIDDIHGWNFADNSNSQNDEGGHGTHVSGIIAANHNVGHITGVAPKSTIIPLDFISDETGSTLNAIFSIRYASLMGAKIVNASWGSSTCSQVLKTEMARLSQEILFVTAAGNEGVNSVLSPHFPGSYNLANQINVGSSSIHFLRSIFSNYGQVVHLVAPGDQIWSLFPNASTPVRRNGTSMAAPMVSGMAALIWSHKPELTPIEVKKLILDNLLPGNFNVLHNGELRAPLEIL